MWRCCTSSSHGIGATDVHLIGHVSNEELVAYYELADVFVCASEHEGFCVPLMEAFHMGVPVIAYAAAAVPATMDGGGVLVDDKDPALVAPLIHEIATNRALQDDIIATQDAALDRLEAKDFGGHCSGSSTECSRSPRMQHPRVAFDFWDQVASARGARGDPRVSAGGVPGAVRRRRSSSVIVNQWVPAAHKGDAIGDSARRVRGLLRELGPRRPRSTR